MAPAAARSNRLPTITETSERRRWEITECFLPPLEEFIAFTVALKFDLGVALEGIRAGEEIHLDRVIDDQINGYERVDLLRVPSQSGHGCPHGCQVNDGGDAGEVLHDHPRRQERNSRTVPLRFPCSDCFNILPGYLAIIALAKGCLQHDPDGERKTLQVGQPRLLQGVKAKDHVLFCPDLQGASGSEKVFRHTIRLWQDDQSESVTDHGQG